MLKFCAFTSIAALISVNTAHCQSLARYMCGGKECPTDGCVILDGEEICANGFVADPAVPMSMRKDVIVSIPKATPEQQKLLREFFTHGAEKKM